MEEKKKLKKQGEREIDNQDNLVENPAGVELARCPFLVLLLRWLLSVADGD